MTNPEVQTCTNPSHTLTTITEGDYVRCGNCGARLRDDDPRQPRITDPNPQIPDRAFEYVQQCPVLLTKLQLDRAAESLQQQTAIASIGLCRTIVARMVRHINEASA